MFLVWLHVAKKYPQRKHRLFWLIQDYFKCGKETPFNNNLKLFCIVKILDVMWWVKELLNLTLLLLESNITLLFLWAAAVFDVVYVWHVHWDTVKHSVVFKLDFWYFRAAGKAIRRKLAQIIQLLVIFHM